MVYVVNDMLDLTVVLHNKYMFVGQRKFPPALTWQRPLIVSILLHLLYINETEHVWFCYP